MGDHAEYTRPPRNVQLRPPIAQREPEAPKRRRLMVWPTQLSPLGMGWQMGVKTGAGGRGRCLRVR